MNTESFEIERKRRSDSALAQLTPEQHAQLRSWLATHSYEAVLKLMAQPSPVGFGIQTHRNTLHRYRCEQIPRYYMEQRATTFQEIKQLALAAKTDPIPFRTVTLELLEQQLMMMSMDAGPNIAHIASLTKLLLKHEELQLKEKQFHSKHPKPLREASHRDSIAPIPEPLPAEATQTSAARPAPAVAETR